MPTSSEIIFLVAGHVDTGKSSMIGHLLYKYGKVRDENGELQPYITEHEMQKLHLKAKENGMTGWGFAYVPDIYDEERDTGKTVDYNPIKFECSFPPGNGSSGVSSDPSKPQCLSYKLIDTPGHKCFIRGLIAGLNDTNEECVGVLMVSAADGEFKAGMGNGQTREDAILLRSSGIEHIFITINKMDLYDYDEKIFEARKNEIDAFLSKLGFASRTYLPISAYQGRGLDDLLYKVTLKYLEMYSGLPGNRVDIKPEVEAEILRIQAKIIQLKSPLIAPGYECMIHIGRREYMIKLDNFNCFDITKGHQIKKKFAKSGEVIVAKIIRADFNPNCIAGFEYYPGQKIILRDGNITVGFGKIL